MKRRMCVNRHWHLYFAFICPIFQALPSYFKFTNVCLFGGRYWKYGLGLIGIRFCKYFSRFSSSLKLQIITRLFACGNVRWAVIGNMGQHWHRYFSFICMLIRFCTQVYVYPAQIHFFVHTSNSHTFLCNSRRASIGIVLSALIGNGCALFAFARIFHLPINKFSTLIQQTSNPIGIIG